MRQRPALLWIWIGISVSLCMPIVGSILAEFFAPQGRYEHLPFHSLIEAMGGLMAVAIAGILVVERPRMNQMDHSAWMASALIGMGVLDLFHAGVNVGNEFVWLHSTATFIGGLFFACVWLPAKLTHGRIGNWLPWCVLACALTFGTFSCYYSGLIPPMTHDVDGVKKFTLLSRGLNIGGGIGFLIAGGFFIRRYHRYASETDWLFSLHTILFGVAGVLFEMSVLWDVAWWWWHILRLIAYIAAFAFAVGAYLNAERAVLTLNRDLRELNQALDQTVEDRTSKLRISEERYALAVVGSTDGLWDWDVLTNEVYYSPRFKELLGYSDEEFPNVFESFELGLFEEDAKSVMIALQAHLKEREPYDVEYRLQTKDGTYRWFRARGQAIWDDSGRATRMAGSITDITDQKLAESSLQQERFLFQALFEHLPDAIYFKDAEGQFTRVTASLARWLGAKDADEVIGKTDADFFPPDYADEARADEQRLMESGQPMIGKEEHPHWDNQQECWVSTTKVPLRNDRGQIIGSFGISHDITEQKMAEERFRRVIEAAPNAMIVVDQEGKIRFVNVATEAMFGYSREDLIGQNVEILVPDEFCRSHVRLRNDYFQEPATRAMGMGRELSGQRKDGGIFPIELGLSPINLDGELVVLSSVNDLTKRKQTEQALVAAKEAAESSNRAKSDFLANMSHEIRTPMNAIIGITELVLETEINKTQSDYLRIVLESAESLLAIINQILDFSKIEAGRLELESLDFNLHEEVGDTLKALGHRAHAKRLELAWHIHHDVPQYLRGDAARLRQILVNLVGNAIKFTHDGEVVVTVRRRPADDATVTLEFTVRDTGVGIPKDRRDQIFAAFEQADTSTTREFGGTGLGLAITARIIEAMNGHIWVEGTEETGSHFHFLADFLLGSAPEEDQIENIDLTDQAVVIVDDNDTNRLILEEVLGSWGLDVASAATGPEGIKALEVFMASGKGRPILISDVHMPNMDGFMLAEEIRSHGQLAATPIILLTSGGHSSDTERCVALDIEIQLIKPAKHSELLDAIISANRQARSTKQIDEKTDAVVVEPETNPNETDQAPSVPSLKILLVEDGKANQVLATGVLKKSGHHVDVAENGEIAVQRWQGESYDLILMDVQMPVMDGFQATRCIRELESQADSHTPIVAMTARAMKGDRERCIQAGMDGYVAKPFRKQELYEVLERLFPTG